MLRRIRLFFLPALLLATAPALAQQTVTLSGRVVEAGTCETVNCSRRAPFSQVDLRVSRSFKLFGHSRIEALAEVFNLFNATNPFIPTSTNRLTSAGASLATFMQPTAYAGDAGQGDQRIAQLGFRITF